MPDEGNPFKLKPSTHKKLKIIMSDMKIRDEKVIYMDDCLNYIISEYAKNHRIKI